MVTRAVTAPAAAARLVVTTMSAKWRLVAFNVEPGLKPNQPNQRISTPSIASGMLWPGIAFGLRAFSDLPIRGPSTRRPDEGAVDGLRGRRVGGAKSWAPRALCSKPAPK